MVGVARFELATPASRRRCSTRLSYTPNRGAAYSQLFCTAQRANDRQAAVCSGAGREPCGFTCEHAPCAVCAAANRIAPLHPPRGLCIYRAPSSLTGPVGASPSGKASVFGTDIPRFESWRPSHPPRHMTATFDLIEDGRLQFKRSFLQSLMLQPLISAATAQFLRVIRLYSSFLLFAAIASRPLQNIKVRMKPI